MGDDQEIDIAGTEADDESAAAKQEGFGEHSRPSRQQGSDADQQPDTQNTRTTIPDEPDEDGRPARGAAVRDRGDTGGAS